MTCQHCQVDIPDGSNYCPSCGANQRAEESSAFQFPLRRSRVERRIAGVCGGLAAYLGVEVTIVRLVLVILTVIPGVVFGGVIAYLLAWLIVPEAAPSEPPSEPTRRLTRSDTDRKIAGVCGGLAEYFGFDVTAARLLWVVLAVVPGAVVGGLAAYLVAWFVMPPPPAALTATPAAEPLP